MRGVQRFVLFDLDDTLVGRAAGLRSWAEEFCGRRGEAAAWIVEADGGWMVGDSATADITGGRTAGLKTCWISRGRPWPLPERSPDRIVGHVTEAISLLPT
ncbi:HAD hydrolase-like protein [Actinocorallia aurantiaca]|uniref:HAD family hydrolase n=1 Tax=Actinocorallia aurantiaca TaxID=46204 RepID=A0ABN3UII7_9ACTN